MYFTLAVSAAARQGCAALVGAALGTDPRVMPIAGPPTVAWSASDGCTAALYWGDPGSDDRRTAASHAGTIWVHPAQAGALGELYAQTGLARVDPVYVAETPGAVVVCDRAAWAAAVTGRLRDYDQVMAGAFLQLGYPLRGATPFRGVRALGGDQALRASGGRLTLSRADGAHAGRGDTVPGGASRVAAALVETVKPLGDAAVPVELSLTGGKDSRLIAAALTAAGVPFRARTHGFAGHPDVIVAGMIAGRLGLEHTVTEPRPAATASAPDQDEVLRRLRSAVLMSDGMLSAFENLGRPDPVTADGAGEPVQAGGHGGELLRGGYAQAAWRPGPAARPAAGARAVISAHVPGSVRLLSSAAATELFRRMTTRRLGLLRPAAAAAYLASLGPSAVALAGGPLRALDDFYLVNRAGRWSAAARQAYLIRAPLVQPFFADRVVRAARAVPLRQRISDRLHRDLLAELCPELLRIPLADQPWQGEPRTAEAVVTAGPASAAAPDWRRAYGAELASFLRGYILDAGGTGPMFEIIRRPAVERLLQPPHADPQTTWTLATLAALLSGDWLNGRHIVSIC
jgi:asparagine synthetase B (glutamine-hydrolysing)